MFTTLVALLCHIVAGVPAPLCVEEVVTDSNYTAQVGKAEAPIEMHGIDFIACQTKGQEIVSKWMAEHPIYRTWQLHGWKCVPGEYVKRGAA